MSVKYEKAKYNLAKFFSKRVGSTALAATIVTMPITGSFAVYSFTNPNIDFDKTTNEASQAVLKEHLSDFREISNIYDNIKVLGEDAKEQPTPELVLEFNKKKQAMELNASKKLEEFRKEVLTDDTLTEVAYDELIDVIKVDDNVSANLPDAAIAFNECRAKVKDGSIKPQADEMSVCMRDLEISDNLSVLAFLLMMLGGSGLLLASIPWNGYRNYIEDVFDEISFDLERNVRKAEIEAKEKAEKRKKSRNKNRLGHSH